MDYSKTVNLPQTSLPMKADLPKREPLMLSFWEKNQTYKQMIEKRKGKDKYILHDGPPYANGHIHMGHALNKILKDMIVKYKSLTGYYSPYVPGWDCHGLPIEHQLMKDLQTDKHSVDRLEFRKKAAEFAMQFVEIQKGEFKRLGILGDWENPYLTLTPHYETIILKVFRELLREGYVYRSKKPVQWCPHCETALAEAEVEYKEKESPAIFVKLKVGFHSGNADVRTGSFAKAVDYIVIWTTTPWTLPANVGLMLHPDLEYAAVFIKSKNETWLLLKSLIKSLLEDKLKLQEGSDYEIKGVYPGRHFSSYKCERLFPNTGEREFKESNQDVQYSQCILSSHVSSEEGTGIVHTAPGHGEVDYFEGYLQNKLPVVSPVDDAGKFNESVHDPELKGLFVLSKGNAKILEMLKQKNALVHEEKIRHSYPHCWRCKNPVIFRATHQWFLNVERQNLRKKMLDQIENVQWVPDYGKNRIRGMIEQRPDWCLSRQRLWGTPLPIFYCKDCGEPLTDDQAVGMVEEIVGLEGSEVWFREEPAYFLKNLTPFKCSQCKSEKFVKEMDILDVWFDSGVSHESVLKGEGRTLTGSLWKDDLKWPASLYLEGSDQHRGWFQSSLIPSVALYQRPPYETVLTHGFIVDGQGKKMSKSDGNVIAPEQILKDYGADVLRLWVASSDYREDIRISMDILKGVAENYRKIRNTLRYLIGNIYDFNVKEHSISYDKMQEVDQWILMRLAKTIENCKKAYETYEFHRVVVSMIEFCALDCSSFHFDVSKDRLYTFGKNSLERRSGQTVLHTILSSLLPLLSPILSFTSEETWQIGLEKGYWTEPSVFLADFPSSRMEWKNEKLEEKWKPVLQLREKAHISLESARKSGAIGSSLEAKLIFYGGSDSEQTVLRSLGKDLPMIFIVSQAEIRQDSGSFQVLVEKASGSKCVRCWRYDETVKKDTVHPDLCSRCIKVISDQ